jgi:hypothetical protein
MKYNERRKLQANQRRGEKWLDKTLPGWFNKIKLSELDLSDPDSCMLGQLSRFMPKVKEMLKLTSSTNGFTDVCSAYDLIDEEKFGFDEDYNLLNGEQYSYLTELWQYRIVMRKIEAGKLSINGRVAKKYLKLKLKTVKGAV